MISFPRSYHIPILSTGLVLIPEGFLHIFSKVLNIISFAMKIKFFYFGFQLKMLYLCEICGKNTT